MTAPGVLPRLFDAGLVMVVRAPSADDAIAAITAARRGGIEVVEVTFTTPDAVQAIARVRTAYDDVLVGAGTVLSRVDAEAAVDAGAQFVVSPGLDLDLLRWAPTDIAVVPGVLSPSEVMRANRAGADAVKLFPAHTVGPAHLRALLAPFPGLRVIPTGGVTPDNAADWLEAGAAAVGIGGALSPNTPVTDLVADSITDEAARAVAAVRSHRHHITQEMT
ncbi:bifunctional 4-hydroxy-2-oxoglutarate aldolase/2-dehydro-3-deoxy-phosphogluconate aldolase [Solicola gregarius]|uniref:Bifunctional 4-hydroxy-2-oxoglutarate aldolase/2-dehydro-3-deoxy-phosphogluconate aldolase n=1 Tax=Solicola gregarius TaxID=2908642 RepID=A0AA46YK12_9ACTN|nr:bifunctional 4-hydroxy-2-oxoglutarate aldolase/2-dehydro-3-deoxy-phosphogluconate aldolase [Solicola gregarius]UYM04962.1 bifunctional 4-hydroxy-2-oxoglutarate aldolase/2-dehydro-3-deoxy-phosphogluconate aldolase [Solicola gregarius]